MNLCGNLWKNFFLVVIDRVDRVLSAVVGGELMMIVEAEIWSEKGSKKVYIYVYIHRCI